MQKLSEFVNLVMSEFPDDRVTWQKSIPTFHPESSEEAARFLRLANDQSASIYITGFGNNIDPVGPPFEEMMTIRTDRLNRLEKLAAEDFYVVVGAGYPLREINAHLADSDLYFPHAHLPYVGSVGGAVAVGLSARLNGHPLPIKKYVIQATVVTPEGEIITPGSVCFKSVSGYDIVKIFSPSWGLLGLLVTIALRVMPVSAAPEYSEMTLSAIDRSSFLTALDAKNTGTDAVYARKIRNRFDPRGILPVVMPTQQSR